MITRRHLLATGLGAVLAGTSAGAASAAISTPAPAVPRVPLPEPQLSGIDHIVVVCMENRSFDHLLGWLPGADGRQAGLAYPNRNGMLRPTHHLTTFQGCGLADPDHSYAGGRMEYRGGACDGWLEVNDEFSIGYYEQADLPFLGAAAPAWTVCDRWFSATLGPTIPNRLYLHAGCTDRIDGSLAPTSLPTIWDRLAAAGVSHRYYFSDVPFLALWGTRHLGIGASYAEFLADAALGTLPAVSYVEPPLAADDGGLDGLSRDDHPHGDIRNGEATMNDVYRAVTSSPAWPRTLLVLTFDEWGGFFDHVPPTMAPDTRPALTGLRGFRVPALLVSPFARRGAVAHDTYDHTSILRLIAWRHGLPPLGPRDAAAANPAEALDFSRPDLSAPRWRVDPAPILPGRDQCLGSAPLRRGDPDAPWTALAGRAVALGW